jgi:hypothetical protein
MTKKNVHAKPYGSYERIGEQLRVGRYQYKQYETNGEGDGCKEENADSDEDFIDDEQVHSIAAVINEYTILSSYDSCM